VKELAQRQFSGSAQRFVESKLHREGDDLPRLVELAGLRGDERVLDVATGGGHTALAFSRRAREVVASDLTPRMLEVAAAFLREQGAHNVRCERADAEALPFPDGSFDVVTARIAPHHFPVPQRFVREAARVLVPGGRFLLDDNMVPEDDEFDAFMHRFEKWRDPSHVRAWRPSEWRAMCEAAGLVVTHEEPLAKKTYDFAEWTQRMRMPEAEREALAAWLLAAPRRCREFFELQILPEAGSKEGSAARVRSLCATFGILVARKPG
jgi:ubiquinone/menaquinone biosynthesis C-methylase UbiE